MIRTVVCQKNGCSGNRFNITSENEKLIIKCIECTSNYEFSFEEYDYIMLSECAKCNSEIFKIFKDTESDKVYAKCYECGEPPNSIYIDADGRQVSYESKLLNEIRHDLSIFSQRIHNLEVNMRDLQGGQNIIEESLAYINRYIVEKD